VRVSTSTLDLVIVDAKEVHLYAPPTYLLKLTLPDRVVDEDAVEESLACCATTTDATNNTTESSGGISVIEEDEKISGENIRVVAAVDGICSTGETSTTATTTTTHIWTKEDLPKLQYNPEKNHGTLVVTLRKEEEGFWQDLDLLGRLQEPAVQRKQENRTSEAKKKSNALIKVIDADCEDADEDSNTKNNENDTSSSEVMDDLLSINKKSPTYGLFQHFSNVFRDYAREGLAQEMLECPNPDEINDGEYDDQNESEEHNKREMRIEMENEKFDPDRYLNDLCVEEEGDMIFDSALMMVPHWMETGATPGKKSEQSVENITNQLTKLSTSDNRTPFFTSEESHLLATLPPHHNVQQLSAEQKRAAFLSLTDILFTYAYDHRTTDGDPTVESSWTVMILSTSMAWLENYNPPYDTVADVVRWSIRRSLVYPYLRSYTLARKIVEDVCLIFKGGRRTIIRCLLQLHRIMEKSESHYLFNKLYTDPLIGWVQRCEENEVQQFGREVEDLMNDPDLLGKQYLDLDLVEREKSFFDYEEEESTSSQDEDDDDDDDDSVDYESDSDSRGVEEDTVGTTDEELSSACERNQDAEQKPDKKVGTNHSAALLDENIGSAASITSGLGNIVLGADEGGEAGKGLIEEA